MITRYRKIQEGEVLLHGDKGNGSLSHVPVSDEELDAWWETRKAGFLHREGNGYQYWRPCEPQPTVPVVITP